MMTGSIQDMPRFFKQSYEYVFRSLTLYRFSCHVPQKYQSRGVY